MNTVHRHKLENIEDIKRFIFGGKAIITIESKRTGKWFTFKVVKSSKNENSIYFVSLLTGVNNDTSYNYMGTIFEEKDKFNFRLTKKSKFTENSLSYKSFYFFFNLLINNKLHEEINVYHSGVCGRCGRKLTVPESLITGFGPECRGLSLKMIK